MDAGLSPLPSELRQAIALLFPPRTLLLYARTHHAAFADVAHASFLDAYVRAWRAGPQADALGVERARNTNGRAHLAIATLAVHAKRHKLRPLPATRLPPPIPSPQVEHLSFAQRTRVMREVPANAVRIGEFHIAHECARDRVHLIHHVHAPHRGLADAASNVIDARSPQGLFAAAWNRAFVVVGRERNGDVTTYYFERIARSGSILGARQVPRRESDRGGLFDAGESFRAMFRSDGTPVVFISEPRPMLTNARRLHP